MNNFVNPRDIDKIDCKTSIKVQLNFNIDKWRLDYAIVEHNYELSISTITYLQSHKKISISKKVGISDMHVVNISITQIYTLP